MYIDKLDDIVNESNNAYHSKIKMKPVDVKSCTNIDFDLGNNDKDPKFEAGDHVRITICKNIFAKVFPPNWSKEFFEIKKVKNTVPWIYIISDLKDEEIVETEKSWKRQIKEISELKK